MPKKLHVALIELSTSHDECLYAQVKMLKADHSIHLTLICHEKHRDNVKYYDLVNTIEYVPISKGINLWLDLFRVRNIILKGNFDKIIFNTAQGTLLKKLLMLPFGNTEMIGTLHNTNKLNGSVGQKIISKKIRKYFVLNDYLLDNINPKDHPALRFSSYYPIFFPPFPEMDVAKNENEIWICIPGQVELKRRDYTSLFDSIEKTGISPSIRFILLGRCSHAHGDGTYIKNWILQHNLTDYFMLFDDFISPQLFHSILKKCDYILPLIHPQHESFDLYKTQVSGAYNLAFAYKKPLLMEKSFATYADFKNNSVFYDSNQIIETINNEKPNNSATFYTEDKWNFDFQKNKYLHFIFS